MNRLKELRRAKGLTQEEIARLLGVQKAAICKYETGRVAIPPDTLVAVSYTHLDVYKRQMLGRFQSRHHHSILPHSRSRAMAASFCKRALPNPRPR